MKGVIISNIQLYIIIVRCEQRDCPPRPSAHHVTERFKKIYFVFLFGLITCRNLHQQNILYSIILIKNILNLRTIGSL